MGFWALSWVRPGRRTPPGRAGRARACRRAPFRGPVITGSSIEPRGRRRPSCTAGQLVVEIEHEIAVLLLVEDHVAAGAVRVESSRAGRSWQGAACRGR